MAKRLEDLDVMEKVAGSGKKGDVLHISNAAAIAIIRDPRVFSFFTAGISSQKCRIVIEGYMMESLFGLAFAILMSFAFIITRLRHSIGLLLRLTYLSNTFFGGLIDHRT